MASGPSCGIGCRCQDGWRAGVGGRRATATRDDRRGAPPRRQRHQVAGCDTTLYGANAGGLLRKLTPITRGWAAYYRTVVSSKTFNDLDNSCGCSPTSGPSMLTR
ncbi:group II intron maturase-specific domain-containing protein [Streptomyces sp. NPDC090499]|uniref:group II intron maturase-specific domain-containing protein n=1 Tax=unclassified Streptomyces TaxID=2593676 RepID=UPI0038113EC7